MFKNLDKPDGFGTPVPFRMYLYTNNVNLGNIYLFVGTYTNAANDIKTFKVAEYKIIVFLFIW